VTRLSLNLRLLVVAAAMTLVLAGMVAVKQYTLATGTLVTLETRPIDPRSLFRGDYVRLRYAISLIDLKELPGDDDVERGDSVYVVLAPGDPFWTPVSVYHAAPTPAEGQVVLRGEVTNHWQYPGDDKMPPTDQLDVTYGIESYFVPEGEGRELEDPSNVGLISIVVAVDRFGNSGIKQILVDGQPRFTEKLF
jgi:uncharacterized membrane-anchored protein